MFACDDGRRTVPYTLVCDFREDCDDASDEAWCVHREQCAGFTCHNGQCLTESAHCDVRRDCWDGWDEVCDHIYLLERTVVRMLPPTLISFDRSVLTQSDIYLVCPPDIWEPGDTIMMQCFVRKLSYPAKCVTRDLKKIIFRQSESRDATYTPMCTLTDILGSCNSTGDCRCGTGNSSHYLFEYEFTAATNKEGYWDCLLPCYDVGFYLLFQEFDCGNRKVYENPNRLKQDLTECKTNSQKEALQSCPTPTDSSSPNILAISLGVGVIGAVCVVIAAFVAGVYIGKRRSGSHQNAPPNDAHLKKAHPNNASLANGPPFNSPAFNSPPENDPQVDGQAGPSTGFASIPEAELDDSSAVASEASEGSEFTAAGVVEV